MTCPFVRDSLPCVVEGFWMNEIVGGNPGLECLENYIVLGRASCTSVLSLRRSQIFPFSTVLWRFIYVCFKSVSFVSSEIHFDNMHTSIDIHILYPSLVYVVNVFYTVNMWQCINFFYITILCINTLHPPLMYAVNVFYTVKIL